MTIAGDESAITLASAVEVRVRVESTEGRRDLGAINDWSLGDPESCGWLVLAAEGENVLEIHMLPDEWASKAAARFEAAAAALPTMQRRAARLRMPVSAHWASRVMLQSHLLLAARTERKDKP